MGRIRLLLAPYPPPLPGLRSGPGTRVSGGLLLWTPRVVARMKMLVTVCANENPPLFLDNQCPSPAPLKTPSSISGTSLQWSCDHKGGMSVSVSTSLGLVARHTIKAMQGASAHCLLALSLSLSTSACSRHTPSLLLCGAFRGIPQHENAIHRLTSPGWTHAGRHSKPSVQGLVSDGLHCVALRTPVGR